MDLFEYQARDLLAAHGVPVLPGGVAETPEQAEKLFLAEEVGTLRLSLRPFGEDEQRKIAPVSNDLPSIVG